MPKLCYTILADFICQFPAKKMKDSLSSFLPNLPGVVDTPGSQDNSSLRGLIEKPPGIFFPAEF